MRRWYRLPDGRTVAVRPGSRTERNVKRRGGQRVAAPDDPAVRAQGGTPPSQPDRRTVKVLIGEASDADLATVERLLQEEYVGPGRKTALEHLRKIRDRKAQEQEG